MRVGICVGIELPEGEGQRRQGRVAERIEAFGADHLDGCAELMVAAFNAEPWNDSYTHDTAKRQLAWHLRVPGFLGSVSVSDGIVAFAVGYREPMDEGDVFHLSIFCVRPDVQRTGIGTRLLQTLEGSLREAGVGTVYLGTYKGTPAEAFYRKHGYTVSDEEIEMSHDLGTREAARALP
jgi:aminoglycoside 6'-N-acetyltransferase I